VAFAATVEADIADTKPMEWIARGLPYPEDLG